MQRIMPAPARHQHKITKPPKTKQQKPVVPILMWLGYVGAAAAMVAIAAIFKDSSIDLALIGLYGLAALVLRLPSEDTFKFALVALVGVPICTLLQQSSLTDNFAQYAFLLLCIGTVAAIIEQWKKK
jgi:hypothetical protein